MADSGLRQILILQKLPRFPRLISTKALQYYLEEHDHKVSTRTIQRDIELLGLKFPIVSGEGSKASEKGWAIEKNFANQSLPVMEPTAALTMLMAMQHLRQLLPKEVVSNLQPYEEEAKMTLELLNGKRGYNSWQDKVRIIPNTPLKPSSISDETIHVIYEGLLKNKKIKATYKESEDQEITPLGLIQRGNQFYLICKFFDFSDIRITALQRYSTVELTDISFKRESFDIDAYIDSGEMAWLWDKNKPIKLSMQASPWAADYLAEFPLSNDQVITAINDSSRSQVKATVKDTYELRWWLLSKGDSFKIEKPKELQKWVISMAENILKQYND